ncbi:MAG: hypothetical protein ACRD22_00615 [Terriglobia bacterium]
MNILNKLTMKAIGAQPPPHSITEAVALAHVFGKANGYKTGSTTYGLYDKFHGEFEGVNLATGEVYVASNFLCPPIMESLIKEALKQAGAEGGKVGNVAAHEADVEGKDTESPVLFAFEVGAKPTAKKDGPDRGNGYEYTVKLLTPARRSDALESLRAISAQARGLSLPAPAPAVEPQKPAEVPPEPPKASEPAQAHDKAPKHASGSRR